LVTKKGGNDFKGRFITRKDKRENNENINPMNNLAEENVENFNNQNLNKKPGMGVETNREKKIRIFKLNSSRILHERNKYVFLASVAERAISLRLKLSDILGFVLIKKLFKMLCYLRYILQNKVRRESELTKD
jgi:serine/threonine-protein kinase ULK/ATG1